MIRQEPAEAMALQALTWILQDEGLLSGFIAETGTSGASFSSAAQEPEFLAAVMDFVLAQDDRVLALSDELSVKPEFLLQVRAALPGGGVPDWT